MIKNKTKPMKAKKKTAKTSSTRVSRPVPAPRDNAVRQAHMNARAISVCSMLDPFCSHAHGGKLMDDSNTRTFPQPIHLRYPVSIDSNGVANVLIVPQYAYDPWTTAATGSLNSVTTWNNFGTTAGFQLSNVNSYRIVNYGIIIRNTTAPLSSAGMLCVRIINSENGEGLAALNMLSYNRSEYLDIPLQDAKSVTIVVPRTSVRRETFFKDSADTNVVTSVNQLPFCPVTIAVTGGPTSGGSLTIEIIANYEIIPLEDDPLALLATPPPKRNADVMDALAEASSSLSSINIQSVEKVSANIKNTVLGVLNSQAFQTGMEIAGLVKMLAF